MATTLIFIRHGESEANYEHRFTGQSNVFDLTERGHAQAQAAAEALNGICVDAIIASDYNSVPNLTRLFVGEIDNSLNLGDGVSVAYLHLLSRRHIEHLIQSIVLVCHCCYFLSVS